MSTRRFYGLLIVVLLLAGVGIPAFFGFLQAKASEIGVNNLLDVSTNWDDTNIANSTYFNLEYAFLRDYKQQKSGVTTIVYDEANSLDIAMFDLASLDTAATVDKDYMLFKILINRTAVLENDVDKIVLKYRILDPGSADLNQTDVRVRFGLENNWAKFFDQTIVAEEAYNKTYTVELNIDAVKRLQLESATANILVAIEIIAKTNTTDLDNLVHGYRVELYDTQKIDSNAISNWMLAIGGFVMAIGALAASPIWNPTRPDSRTRRVLGKVKRRRR